MNSRIQLKRGLGTGFFLVLLIAFLVASDLLVNYYLTPSRSRAELPLVSGTASISASNVSGLINAWNYRVGGILQFATSPTVANGVIYIGLISKNRGADTGRLDALDAKTGARLWSYATAGPPAAPIISDGIVYISWPDDTQNITLLDALDAKTGAKLWSYTAQGSFLAQASYPELIVADGYLYLSDLNGLHKLDAKTGLKLWNVVSERYLISVAKGFVFSSGSNGNNVDTFDALNAKTGARLWSYTTQWTLGDPAVASGVVYLVSRGNPNGESTAPPDMLVALDATTGTKLWSYTADGFLNISAIANGIIYSSSVKYTATSIGTVNALDAKTGAKLWSYNGGKLDSVANGVAYSDSGSSGQNITLRALDAESGRSKWSYDRDYDSSIDTSAAGNGVLYLTSKSFGKLSAINARTGAKLWVDFIGVSLESSLAATSTSIYVSSYKTLIAFTLPGKASSPKQNATATPPVKTSARQSLFPSINKAPVFADVPGLHIQSMDGLQCPLHKNIYLSIPPGDLVFSADRLTYTPGEIQQIKNYLHTILYGTELLSDAYKIAPPPTLRWVAGSSSCTLPLEISNTGNVPLQISALGVQLASDPQPNRFQDLHTFDYCTVADQADAAAACHAPSGGGGCGSDQLSIALQPAAHALSVFTAPVEMRYDEGGVACQYILQPNDTLDFSIVLTSPGGTAKSVAPYIYSVVPQVTVTGPGGSDTYALASMAGIAAFIDEQRVTCYTLQNGATTFVPVGNSYAQGCMA